MDGEENKGEVPNTEHTVFFSYSRKDRDRVQSIISAIEAEGYSVWWDGKLEPGTRYLEKTEYELENANAIIVVWSTNSTQSNWVRDEAMVGRESANLIPLSLDGAVPPLGFRQFQVTDFSNWKGDPEAFEFQALLRQLAQKHDQPVSKPVSPISVKTPPKLSRRDALILGGAAILGLGAVGWVISSGQSSKVLASNGIVVLPFSNVSGDEKLDYISTGLADGVRTALMQNSALRVVARGTSEAMKARGLGAAEIAQELGVSLILDGSLNRVGSKLVMLTELVDGSSGTGRWSKEYPANEDQLVQIHDQLVDSISQAVASDQSNGSAQSKITTSNAAAYHNYLLGLDAYRKAATPDEAANALLYFDEAIGLDPGFAQAHAQRALILSWLSSASEDAEIQQEKLQAALSAAKRAVELRPDRGELFSTLGWIEFFSAANIPEASAAFERSIEFGQGNASVLARYSTYASLVGKNERSIESISKAVSLDPANADMHKSKSIAQFFGGDYRGALQSAEAAHRIDEDVSSGWYWRAMSEAMLGKLEDAKLSCEKEPISDARYVCSGVIDARMGDLEGAKAYLEQLVSERGVSSSYQQAQILAQLNRTDEAMAALRAAYKAKNAAMIMLKADPLLQPVRKLPEYSALLSKTGLASN